MLKFDLGGTNNHDGYISVNLAGNPEIKSNILDLSFCKDDSVDEFFMSHTYEHLSPTIIKQYMKEIQKKLKTNGILRIVQTDVKKTLELYKNNNINFYALRNIVFSQIQRRIDAFNVSGLDLQAHQSMWGVEELKNELLFYGFSSVSSFDAGSWKFDMLDYFPNEEQQSFHKLNVPNLGVIAIK